MRTLIRTLIVVAVTVAPVYAANGYESKDGAISIIVILFLAYNALFIVPNFIAALVVLAKKLRELKLSHSPQPVVKSSVNADLPARPVINQLAH
jgi:hypothetical protein